MRDLGRGAVSVVTNSRDVLIPADRDHDLGQVWLDLAPNNTVGIAQAQDADGEIAIDAVLLSPAQAVQLHAALGQMLLMVAQPLPAPEPAPTLEQRILAIEAAAGATRD